MTTTDLKTTRGVFSTMFSVKWLAILLIGSQLVVKFLVEFPAVSGLNTTEPIYPVAWLLTAGWLILMPLCIQDNRGAFLVAAIWGVVNAILAVLPPLTGICNHLALGTAIGIQCLLIAVACYLAYKTATPQTA